MFSTFNKDCLFFMIWLLVLVSVIIITLFYEIESTSFYGIAETRELVANSENSVEIKRINVVEGQAIVKGQLVVELISPELNMKINYISHQLDQLKAQKGVSKTELKSKINQLKAEKATKRNEINNQVKRLENELKINKALTAGLKSIKTNKTGIPTKTGANNPMQLRIESLRQELAFSLNPLNIQIDLYQQELDASNSPIKIRIERLGKELELLALENNKLNIYSQLTGVIGSINYKPGEKVVPFAPILTFHTKNPLFIKGFINENVYTNVQTGEELKVKSVSDSQRVISGKVVGVGSRIIEYPVRLRRHPDLQVWGREIIIKIPENNSFILGEKVIIDATNNKTSIIQKLKKVLSLNVAHSQNYEDQDIRIKEKDIVQIGEILTIVPKQTKNIEASGLLYLKDIDLYLVVSDDTPKNKFILFLMNPESVARFLIWPEITGNVQKLLSPIR